VGAGVGTGTLLGIPRRLVCAKAEIDPLVSLETEVETRTAPKSSAPRYVRMSEKGR
jgi:hypothetical protein